MRLMLRAEQWAKLQCWDRTTRLALRAVSIATPRKIPCGDGRDLKLKAPPERSEWGFLRRFERNSRAEHLPA